MAETAFPTLQHLAGGSVQSTSKGRVLLDREKDKVEITLEYLPQAFEIDGSLQVVVVIHACAGKRRRGSVQRLLDVKADTDIKIDAQAIRADL